VTSGTLTFDDGSSASVGQLPNDGTSVSVSLGNKTISQLRFTVNSVSSSTLNIGLAEIAVFGSDLIAPVNGTDGTGTPVGGGASGNSTLPIPGGNGNTTLPGNTTVPGNTTDLPSVPSGNIALLATATASSSSTDQGWRRLDQGMGKLLARSRSLDSVRLEHFTYDRHRPSN
jgi:hypothetical protein